MWSAVVSLFMGLFSLFLKRKPAIVTEGEQLGSATQEVADLKSQAKTQADIADAEAQAPNTAAGVVDRLEQGSF